MPEPSPELPAPATPRMRLADVYVWLFLLFNVFLLPVGVFLAVGLANAGPYGYGGLFLVLIGAVAGIAQPMVGIPVSVCYVRRVRWAKPAMLAVLSLILAAWTLLTAYLWFFAGREMAFVWIWLVVAALTLPGILLVAPQRPHPRRT